MSRNQTVILCVDHAYVSGGQSKVAIESAIGLKAAGLHPIFFSAVPPIDPRLAESDIETHCLGQHDILSNPSRIAAMAQGVYNVQAVKKLKELLDRYPDAIIHIHGWAKALSPAYAKALRDARRRAVYTMHEYFLFCPSGGFFDHQKLEHCELSPLSASCWARHCDSRSYPIKIWRNIRLTVGRSLLGMEGAISDFALISNLQEEMLAPYLPKDRPVWRIDNPVEAKQQPPKDNPASGDYLFVGRLSAEKGADLFAQAAEKAGVKAVFMGDGPLMAELRAKYPQAEFLGWRNSDGVSAAMRAARCLVFPSLWAEGQPLTVYESLAAGTPAIVADGCAAKEAIIPETNGLLFKNGDKIDLARVLERCKNDALITRMAHGATDHYWREPKTLERHIAHTLKVYDAVLARASS